MKEKFYVVWVGKKPGIYTNWTECQKQINQFFNAKYKSYPSRMEAEKAYKEGWEKHWGTAKTAKGSKAGISGIRSDAAGYDAINMNSISVDVGCRGNPGIVEYKGVDTKTGEVIFSHGPISKGTNNLGEFLAIVHGLAYLYKEKSNKAIYTDSVNAILWVKKKEVASTLVRDETTKEIWILVDRAVAWLQTHKYTTQILKWNTKEWGEIKADYGRK